MTFPMTTEEWNTFAIGLEQTLTALMQKDAEQAQKIEALEAWVCRRPNEAIPQPFIDQIRAEAIASVTPPAEPEPEPEAEGEVSDGQDDNHPVADGE